MLPVLAVWPAKVRGHPSRRQAGRSAHYNGPPSPFTHFRKRSNLSGYGASRTATFVAPRALRSYRATGQTLLSQSPPLYHHPARCHPTRYGERFPR